MDWDLQSFLPEAREYVIPEFEKLKKYGQSRMPLSQLQTIVAGIRENPASWFHYLHFSGNLAAFLVLLLASLIGLIFCVRQRSHQNRIRQEKAIVDAVRTALNKMPSNSPSNLHCKSESLVPADHHKLCSVRSTTTRTASIDSTCLLWESDVGLQCPWVQDAAAATACYHLIIILCLCVLIWWCYWQTLVYSWLVGDISVKTWSISIVGQHPSSARECLLGSFILFRNRFYWVYLGFPYSSSIWRSFISIIML